MNAQEQYKEEAMRLLDHYPLEVCQRLAELLNGRGWTLREFNVKVEVFESFQWYARIHIKTDVTTATIQEKWEQLVAACEKLDMVATLYKAGHDEAWEQRSHRSYGSDWIEGRRIRVCKGKWHEFHLQFKPARALEVSVLTEENV